MRRREFIGGLAALGTVGCSSFRRSGEAYSVAVLGDTHYDAAPDTTYHLAFRIVYDGTGKFPGRFKSFARNAKMWAGPSRDILEASAKCVTPDTRFVLQLGDLVQGDCADFAVHRKMLGDALSYMRGVYSKDLPFLSVCGNHDIRHGSEKCDNAAALPYEQVMIPYAREQVARLDGSPVEGTTYGFMCGPDLYVVVNFNDGPSTLPSVRQILKEHRRVRYTFVVTHGGVFPFDSWSRRWFYLGKREESDARRELRGLLAERNAIVLCGHTHHLELKEAKFPEGWLTEMTMNTVLGNDAGGENPARPEVVREGPDRYGTTDWATTLPDVKALFDEYRPHMTRYYLANAVGHARLRVSDEGVWFDYYGRDALDPTKTFLLR